MEQPPTKKQRLSIASQNSCEFCVKAQEKTQEKTSAASICFPFNVSQNTKDRRLIPLVSVWCFRCHRISANINTSDMDIDTKPEDKPTLQAFLATHRMAVIMKAAKTIRSLEIPLNTLNTLNKPEQ